MCAISSLKSSRSLSHLLMSSWFSLPTAVKHVLTDFYNAPYRSDCRGAIEITVVFVFVTDV